VRYLRTILLEALRSLVPVSTHTLRGQLYLLIAFIYDLAETKVCDLHLSVVKDYVLGLQIVMDNLLVRVVKVLKPT
jgi:hypothetical protein